MALAQRTNPEENSALAQLVSKAKKIRDNSAGYVGDITPQETYAFLLQNGGVLVDVRTPSEWQLGVPDLSRSQGKLVKLSWKTQPDYALNPQFVPSLAGDKTISKDTPLFFLCRSGGRSSSSATAMTQAGYHYCFNIEGGFEGRPEAQGWQASQLPWGRE